MTDAEGVVENSSMPMTNDLQLIKS